MKSVITWLHIYFLVFALAIIARVLVFLAEVGWHLPELVLP